MTLPAPRAANQIYRLPPRLFNARCRTCWLIAALLLLIGCSFYSLELQWSVLFSSQSAASMGRFMEEFFPPDRSPNLLLKVWAATLETLAMSLLGTLLAAGLGLLLALPACRSHAGDPAPARAATRILLNALRSVPELVWATLLLIAAGLGPFAGTLALSLHTSGVLGRLFAEAIENAAPEAGFALRSQGLGKTQVFLYASLPQILPQLLSYTLYRWENNIRAAAVLGLVGAGGLGQMLAFHLGLFQLQQAATVLLAMLVLVLLVDACSYSLRQKLVR